MTEPRVLREQLEMKILSPRAVCSAESAGRRRDEQPCPLRTCFQRDVDRIVHAKSFRRLKHKTQVFLQPEGDHYRARMTHTLAVSRIARTIARALSLNEDLTEAIALGHDLGHTPFGHAGERELRKHMAGGFEHNEQSLRVVDVIENDGAGLNLSQEVRLGILGHTGSYIPETLEGQVVRISDRIAYVNHDLDDALRAGILTEQDVPDEIVNVLGTTYSSRINKAIIDVVESSAESERICMSPEMYFIMESFRDFMFESVYQNPVAKGEEGKAMSIIGTLFDYYLDHISEMPHEYIDIAEQEGNERAVCDYVSGMTDQYAVEKFSNLFIPASWQIK